MFRTAPGPGFRCAGVIAAAAVAALAASSGASASVILSAGGWQASVDDSFDASVSLEVVSVDIQSGVMEIRKIANFDRIDEFTGLPDSIVIHFLQTDTDANTVSRIVMVDEAATNNTGIAWTSFQMALLPTGNAVFNAGLSAGFDIAPFTNANFGGSTVTFSGGVVFNGQTWTPGLPDGELVIDVDLSPDGAAVFNLKELPIPTPGSLALFSLAGLAMARRRRN